MVRRFNGGRGVKRHSYHCQIRSMEWGMVRRFNGGGGGGSKCTGEEWIAQEEQVHE